MDGRRFSQMLMKKCNIFYKKELLSDDEILKRYMDFLAGEFFSEKRSISFSLHTGSKCFDVLSIVIAALRCILLEVDEYSCVGVPLFRRNGYRQSGGRKPLFRNRDTALN